jgi:predicted N-acetyltransferase YhbS
MTVRIRPMTAADVDGATAALLRGEWGERRTWFEFAVSHPACDAFVAAEGDEVLGTGVATRHGPVGWVGTIYVVPERRRQGLGDALSRVVCEALEAAGCRTLVLAASTEGRPVYARLGFTETAWYRIVEQDGLAPDEAGDEAGPPDPDVRPFTADDLPAAGRLDRAATGEDRALTIAACSREPGGLALAGPDGVLRAFALRAPWGGVATIAPAMEDAVRILRARLRVAGPGHPVRTGLVDSNVEGLTRLAREGWVEVRRIVRMERGAPVDWHPEAIWGQWGFAVG